MNSSVLQLQHFLIGYTSGKQSKAIAPPIHLSAQKGEMIGIVGQNGIGKSTLLRSILQFQPQLDGEILIHNQSISSIKDKDLAQEVSVVLTDKLPASALSVYELVALGRQPYTNWVGELTQQDKTIIEAALQFTGTSELSFKKHTELSDGQLQRVMIARALAQDTPIILLDEPTSHLDLVHKLNVFKLLRNLADQEQKTILFTTHDIEMAIDFCDKILVMTPDFTVFDAPDNLIENGVFQQVFTSEDLLFDKEKKRFIYTR